MFCFLVSNLYRSLDFLFHSVSVLIVNKYILFYKSNIWHKKSTLSVLDQYHFKILILQHCFYFTCTLSIS